MKLAVIVTEYPKSTETFIYRDLIALAGLGVEIRLYHLTPYRCDQLLHRFAEPTRAVARHVGFLSRAALGAFVRTASRRPIRLARTIARIVAAQAREPRLCAKSLALIPQALAIAADARAWGATHVHAEFAGHPATAAWIGRRCGVGPPYSVSCRAHDIFRSQRLLDAKLGEASAIRTVSAFGRDFLRARMAGLATREIHVIHSSVDVAAILSEDRPRDEARFRILYVGALEPKKGVAHLLDALAIAGRHLGDWTCELIGDGPSALELRDRVVQLGLDQRVQFRGLLVFEEVDRAYRTADVCVAPSVIGPNGRQEGIPNVMIEALAHRRPVVTTAISGIPELVRDGVTGLLVTPGDPHALAAALRRIYDDPAAAAAMAARGRRHVEAEFDLAVNVRRQLALFAG